MQKCYEPKFPPFPSPADHFNKDMFLVLLSSLVFNLDIYISLLYKYGKKMYSGVICIENLTLGVLLIVILLFTYFLQHMYLINLWFKRISRITVKPSMLNGISTRHDPFNDPFAP